MRRTFEEFEEAVREWLGTFYGNTCTFRLQDVIKNNQVTGKGLFIEENGKRVSTVIDMEAYFKRYRGGWTRSSSGGSKTSTP